MTAEKDTQSLSDSADVSGSDRCLVSSLERLANMDCSCTPIVGSEFCNSCKAAKALNEAKALMEFALRDINSANDQGRATQPEEKI